MTTWTAGAAEELREISGLIGDAYFDVGDVLWDERVGVVVVPFAQEWDWVPLNQSVEWRDAPPAEVVRLSRRRTGERVPFMRGTVRVEHVREFIIDANAGDAGMLLGLIYDPEAGTLMIHGVSGNMTATVNRLGVTAELSPSVVAVYVLRRKRLGGPREQPLWDSSPGT